MKSAMWILIAVALVLSVECFEDREESVESEEETEGEFEPRFLAVFLETEGGSYDEDIDSETGVKVNMSQNTINKVLPAIRNGSISRMTNILANLSAVNKFETVMEKLGLGNSTTEVGDGSTSDDTAKFRNILTTLENSNLSNSTLTKVEEILNKIESGDEFTMYRV